MKTVTIDFKDGDVLTIDCMDMVLNNGFVTVFIPEDEYGNKTVQAFNMSEVSSFEFVQPKEEEEEA